MTRFVLPLAGLLVAAAMSCAATAAGLGTAGSAAVPYHVSIIGAEDAAQLKDGRTTVKGRVRQTRDSLWGGRDLTSDGRVTGTFRLVLSQDEYPSGRIDFWSVFTLRNTKGVWRGNGFGFRDAVGSHYISSLAKGTGAYAGLTYRTIVVDYRSGTATEHTFELFGWIERGTESLEPSSPQGHVKVTAKESTTRTRAGTESRSEALTYTRGAAWSGSTDASDTRLDGVHRVVLETLARPNGRQDMKGTYTVLRGRKVTWLGHVWGVRTPDGRQLRWIDAKGTGANAGLRYRAVARSSAGAQPTSQEWRSTGWIEPVR
jgi:hypothetical protein